MSSNRVSGNRGGAEIRTFLKDSSFYFKKHKSSLLKINKAKKEKKLHVETPDSNG